jgi:transcriptional regulator with XRE-family HTH domain
MYNFDYLEFAWLFKETIYKKQLELRRRISFREIAKETGVSHATISRVLKVKKLEIDTVINLCKWMNEDINQFIVTKEKLIERRTPPFGD